MLLRGGRVGSRGASVIRSRAAGSASIRCSIVSFLREPAQAVTAAGAANGVFAAADCIARGVRGGHRVGARSNWLRRARDRQRDPLAARLQSPPSPKFQWLAALKGLRRSAERRYCSGPRLAAREGYVAAEHAKRYTTTGMGVDQGKIGNIAALAVLGCDGAQRVRVGTTTFRPPYVPVTIGALAGRDIGRAVRPGAQDADRRLAREGGCGDGARGTLAAACHYYARGEKTGRCGRARMPRRAGAARACSTRRRSARSSYGAAMPRSC